MPSWREIEAALIEVLREEWFTIDRDVSSGDVLLFYPDLDLTTALINLTTLAKDLEKELSP